MYSEIEWLGKSVQTKGMKEMEEMKEMKNEKWKWKMKIENLRLANITRWKQAVVPYL